ncbi:MAG: FAD-binding oxidoreductase [Acidimicrobiales bacterium]|jgi:decaprenylphospho-beta-D-ribofuranose 2-oxidase
MKAPSRRELLAGWGRAPVSAATVIRPGSAAEIGDLVAGSRGPLPMIARGLGRSYGDAAQCAGGLVVDCTGLNRILDLDVRGATVRAEAGVSIDDLLRVLVPRGLFLPVTPGTRFVTLGGAIASDVHGKNHHVDGTVSRHLDWIRVATPGGLIECTPEQRGEVFSATCGGMGLTGVILEVALRLLAIETSSMLVDTERAADLDACMARLSEDHDAYRYSVAWVDGLSVGRHLGRSVLTRANHALVTDLPVRARRDPLQFQLQRPIGIPVSPPISLLNSTTVAAFNEMWFRRSPRHRTCQVVPLGSFFYPLDGVAGWNQLYGPRGFTQYQFVVPLGAEASLRTVLERLSRARTASFLAVLKRFGPEGSGHLSFPAQGWTLALDVPLGSAGTAELLDGLDELVASAGGRVYLSKDGRLGPEMMAAMYPRLADWLEIRESLDPDGVFGSDLACRLGIAGGRRPVMVKAKA